jgi:hypothetical protein
MDTTFARADIVHSTVTAQGLTAGHDYLVLDAIEQPTPFGTFVTYIVRELGGDRNITVGNGHLLLDLIEKRA